MKHRIENLIASALVAAAVSAVSASAASGPPLPVNATTGKVAYRGERAQDQRIADLDARLRDTEAVVGWVRRCVGRDAVEVAPGRYALTLKVSDPTCTRDAR